MSSTKKENEELAGVHHMGRIEKAVLEAWKRGERTAQEVSEITGIKLEKVCEYIPL